MWGTTNTNIEDWPYFCGDGQTLETTFKILELGERFTGKHQNRGERDIYIWQNTHQRIARRGMRRTFSSLSRKVSSTIARWHAEVTTGCMQDGNWLQHIYIYAFMYAILSWLLKSVDPWVKSMYCIRFLQISQESALGQHSHWGLGSLGLRDGSLCLLWHDHLAAAGRWCRCNFFVTPMNYGMVPLLP